MGESIEDEAVINEQELVISRSPLLRQPYTWLVICDGERQIFYNIAEGRYDVLSIPELQNKHISCCYQGCLVLADKCTTDCTLLNILTMEKVQLPPLSTNYYPQIVLSSAKIDGNCCVLFMEGRFLRFRSCHVGDDEFVTRKLTINDKNNIALASTNFEGKLYALTMVYDLVVSDFSVGNLQFEMVIEGGLADELMTFSSDMNYYLIESCGELLYVYTGRFDSEVLEVLIFRANFSKKTWAKVESLGDRVIFLDLVKGFCSPASACGVRGNAVYFVNEVSRHLYVYDVTTLEPEPGQNREPEPVNRNRNSGQRNRNQNRL